jgi:GTPase SAR1 family protein
MPEFREMLLDVLSPDFRDALREVFSPRGEGGNGITKTMRFAMSLWKQNGAQQHEDAPPPVVRLGVVGQEAAGKTCMLNGLRHVMRDTKLVSGLEFSRGSPEEVLEDLRIRNLIDTTTGKNALASTRATESFIYYIRQGYTRVLKLIYHDHIGQMIMMTKAELGDREGERKTFLNNVKDAHVLWAVVSLHRSPDGKIWLDRDEADVVKSYVTEALERRSDAEPLTLAVVVTKADLILGADGDEKKIKQELMRTVDEQFRNLAEYSRRVNAAAVFPTSAFGWDNSEEIADKPGFSRTTKGRMEPYNLDKLLLWSLVQGLEQPRKPRHPCGLDFKVASRLNEVLGRLPTGESDDALVLKSAG